MRESNVGTKIFEVAFVPSKESAPVDDDLEFQEDLEKRNSTVSLTLLQCAFLFKGSIKW